MTRPAADDPALRIEVRRGSGAAGQEASRSAASTERDDPKSSEDPSWRYTTVATLFLTCGLRACGTCVALARRPGCQER